MAGYSRQAMSDLQLVPERGRSPFSAVVVAVLLLTCVALAVFLLNPRRTAELIIPKVELFSPHTAFKDLSAGTKSMHVLDQAPAAEDNLYVVATVRVTDKLRLPLFLFGWNATMTAPDGSIAEGTSVPAHDLERLTDIFPALAPLLKAPLHDGDEVTPGSTREGTVVVLFPGMTAASWQTRKLARLTLNLRNQEPQTAILP